MSLAPTSIQPRYTVGTNPGAVAVADLNAEGLLDIVTENLGSYYGSISTNLSVLLGAAGNSFTAQTTYTASVASGVSLSITNLNADANPDVLVVNSGAASVLLGTGTGTFGTQTSYSVGGATCAVGDVNADGRLDLVCGDSSWSILEVALGNANGTFATATSSFINTYLRDIAVGDVDGNGMAEVAAVDNVGSHSVLIYPAQSNGTPSNPTQPISYPIAVQPSFVEFVDINGDKALDLVVFSGSTMLVLLNDGKGVFGSPITTSGIGTSAHAFGDINRDGKLDLATAYYSGGEVNVR